MSFASISLTATRLIREREHGSGRHVPIMAVTAGATTTGIDFALAPCVDVVRHPDDPVIGIRSFGT